MSQPATTAVRPAPSPIQPMPQGPDARGMSTFSADTLRGNPTEAYEKFGIEVSSPDTEPTSPGSKTDIVIDMEDSNATPFPNKWAAIRHTLREPVAEFLGTMILVMFGTGAACQVNLSASTAVAASQKGDYLTSAFGWGVGVALGVWVSDGISGGHINPAVTLASAIFRGFSWKKVPAFILAQVLGACTGAGLVFANYHRAIDLFEGGSGMRSVPGTAGLFTTFPLPYMSNAQCFFQEFLATALLLIVVCAVTDKRNGPPPAGMLPLALFITVFGIGICFGMQTSYAINPARDIGPRLMCWMAGYGRQVWNFRGQYWLYAPIIGPIAGAFAGTAIYDGFLYTGSESVFNKPNTGMRRQNTISPV
ncbi:aquaporin, Major intrinsic protein family [Ceratobasidium sp. AG-Ba]|nr:aquaporin, Major intrinsic protein family [Ceratobasidium sp. AG-Ba]QRW02541.1 aquaporin, Major intrinsic protein family [Ceratobasidium sp. AG-Ba]